MYDDQNYQVEEQHSYFDENGAEQHLWTVSLFPHDNAASTPSTVRTALLNLNKVNEVLESKSYRNGTLLSQTNTIYNEFMTDLVLPKKVQSQKPGDTAEDRIEFVSYDTYGNPLQIRKTNGTHISYVWGHDSTVPVAKVINASQQDIEALQYFGQGYTITGNLSANQKASLRGMANAQVSIYDFDPLVGMTSSEDPRGYVMTYHYDDFNRLQMVKDADGNILSKNDYHYRTQN